MRRKSFTLNLKRNNSAGFTLVELICVVGILSLLAALIIPRFSSLQTKAIEKQEDAIITALKEGVNHKHLLNITSGIGDVWPGEALDPFLNNTPFDLVSSPPPSGAWFFPPDNVRWRTSAYLDYWLIFCPHFDGNGVDPAVANKGRSWVYRFGNGGSNPYGLNPGELRQFANKPH